LVAGQTVERLVLLTLLARGPASSQPLTPDGPPALAATTGGGALGPLPQHPDPDALLVTADLALHWPGARLAVLLAHDTSLVQDTVDSTTL